MDEKALLSIAKGLRDLKESGQDNESRWMGMVAKWFNHKEQLEAIERYQRSLLIL